MDSYSPSIIPRPKSPEVIDNTRHTMSLDETKTRDNDTAGQREYFTILTNNHRHCSYWTTHSLHRKLQVLYLILAFSSRVKRGASRVLNLSLKIFTIYSA